METQPIVAAVQTDFVKTVYSSDAQEKARRQFQTFLQAQPRWWHLRKNAEITCQHVGGFAEDTGLSEHRQTFDLTPKHGLQHVVLLRECLLFLVAFASVFIACHACGLAWHYATALSILVGARGVVAYQNFRLADFVWKHHASDRRQRNARGWSSVTEHYQLDELVRSFNRWLEFSRQQKEDVVHLLKQVEKLNPDPDPHFPYRDLYDQAWTFDARLERFEADVVLKIRQKREWLVRELPNGERTRLLLDFCSGLEKILDERKSLIENFGIISRRQARDGGTYNAMLKRLKELTPLVKEVNDSFFA